MKKLVLVAATFIAIAIVVIVVMKTSDDKPNDSKEEVTEIKNETDLGLLSESEYTKEGFDALKIGDSLEDVQNKLAIELVDNGEVDGQQFYTYDDVERNSKYFFFFENGALKDISVQIVE